MKKKWIPLVFLMILSSNTVFAEEKIKEDEYTKIYQQQKVRLNQLCQELKDAKESENKDYVKARESLGFNRMLADSRC